MLWMRWPLGTRPSSIWLSPPVVRSPCPVWRRRSSSGPPRSSVWLHCPIRGRRGSSIMPQKRNPDAAELIRAKAAGFLARLQGLGALLKGLPLAYNKDLQEDKLYVFASREGLDLCLDAMTAMIQGIAFDRDQGRRAAEGGYAQATDVADYLADKGVPFREAHRLTGRLVALLAAESRPLAAATRAGARGDKPPVRRGLLRDRRPGSCDSGQSICRRDRAAAGGRAIGSGP